jgi:antitoxin VapB
MARSKVSSLNGSQIVRLPKAMAFPDDVRDVEILKVGNTRIVSPVGHRWDAFFEYGPRFSEDFMTDREQPPMQERKY